MSSTNLPVERAVGILRIARSYIDAAKQLDGGLATSGDLLFPRYYLFGHGIELALKAFLVSRGTTDKQLRDYGHDLEASLAACQAVSTFPTLTALDVEVLTWLNAYYSAKEFEYLSTGFKSLPNLKDVGSVADGLITKFEPLVAAAARQAIAASKTGGTAP